MQPGFFYRLLLICQFEIKRSLATRRGLLSLLTFAIVWYFILLYPLRFAADLVAQEKGFKQGYSFFDFIGFGSLQHWPIPEFGVYWQFSLVIFPLLSVSIAADQFCSDRERGTLRFIVLRSSRDSLFFGRFSGVMVIQSLLIGVTALSTLALTLYRDVTLLPLAISSLFIVIISSIFVILPFTALMSVLSAQVKSARQATIWAILIWMFLAGIISLFAHYLPVLAFLKWLIPGYQLSSLAKLSEWDTFQLAYIPILQSIVLLALGRWIMLRQAL